MKRGYNVARAHRVIDDRAARGFTVGQIIFGGNTACVEVRQGSSFVILDAGSGLCPLGHHIANSRQPRADAGKEILPRRRN